MADTKSDTAEKKVTKNEAVRRALAELGNDASRQEIKAFVKEKFGLEMSADHVSTAKGEILRKAAKAKSNGKKAPKAPKAPKVVEAAPEVPVEASVAKPTPVVKPAPVSNGIPLADLFTLQDMMRRLGTDQLHQLIDMVIKS